MSAYCSLWLAISQVSYIKGVAHRTRSSAPRRAAPRLLNSNTLFSMRVHTPAAPFGVCPWRPTTAQDRVQNPAAPQSAIYIVLYKIYIYVSQIVVNVYMDLILCCNIHLVLYLFTEIRKLLMLSDFQVTVVLDAARR